MLHEVVTRLGTRFPGLWHGLSQRQEQTEPQEGPAQSIDSGWRHVQLSHGREGELRRQT